MPGVKRKFSSAFKSSEAPSKLVKRTTSSTVSRTLSELRKGCPDSSFPIPMPCFPPLVPSSEAIKEVDEEITEVTTLRRVSTLPLAEESSPTDASTKPSVSEKKSSAKKPSTMRKETSVDSKDVVTTITRLKSGSSIGKIEGVSKEASAKLLSKKSTKVVPEASCSSAEPKRTLSKGKSLSKKATSAAATPWLPPGGLMEIVFSFDTTGSMSSCLDEVRGRLKDMIQRLQADIPGIRIAVIAHGDYCDASKYVIKWVDFGATLPELCDFVSGISSTSGGDGDECYELVLKTTSDALSWTPGSQRSLVIIGDSNPHEVTYHFKSFGDFEPIDWHEELDCLVDKKIKIYGVHAKGYANSKPFYETLAKKSGGRYLKLDQFSDVFDMMMAICYREKGVEAFEAYEEEVRERKEDADEEVDWGLELLFDALRADVARTDPKRAAKMKFVPRGAKKASSVKFTPPPKPLPSKPAKTPKPKTPKKTKPSTAKKTKPVTVKKTTKVVKKAKTTVKTKPGTKKTQKKQPKKIKRLKKIKVLKKRENIADTTFLRGPLAKLKWTSYQLGLSRVTSGGGTKKEEWSPRRKGYEGYRRKELFDRDTDVYAVYEIGVSPPNSTKKYPVFYHVTTGFLRDRIWDSFILRKKNIGKQVDEVVSKGGDIFVRRGVFRQRRSDQLQNVCKYLNTFDYAWKKRGLAKRKHRSLIHPDNKFIVSNDKY